MSTSEPAATLRFLDVIAKRQLTPNMLRITMGGNGMADFPQGAVGGYIKLRLYPNGGDKAVVRTFTVRVQREGEIDVDFTLHTEAHGEHGPATEWALRCAVGERVELRSSVGQAKPLPAGHAFYLIAGDMTALPSIAVNLENLDEGAKGYAVIAIQDEADQQKLQTPLGVKVEWVISPAPAAPELLAGYLRKAAPNEGDIYGWAAAEFESMKAMRALLRDEIGLSPDRLYISSYWKAGLAEEAHKLVKREDAEANGG